MEVGIIIFKIYICVTCLYFILNAIIFALVAAGYEIPFSKTDDEEEGNPFSTDDDKSEALGHQLISGAIPVVHIFLVISLIALITRCILNNKNNK